MEPVGEKLKTIRQEIGLSGRKLAELSGVSWHVYRSWEHQSKKPFLPIDAVKKLQPVLETYNVLTSRIWELAGVTPDMLGPQKPWDEIQLSDGKIARGIFSQDYTDTSDIAKMRYVGPGLVVVVEIEFEKETTIQAYKIDKHGAEITFVPLAETPSSRRLFYLAGDRWYQGKVSTTKQDYNCCIKLVVREISTQHNSEFLA